MAQRTKTEIEASMKVAIQEASPQVRIDVEKGPFYYLSIKGVSEPLADASARVERLAQLSTLAFPDAATDAEVLATTRAFGVGLGTGGFAGGLAYVHTGRRPVGSETFAVEEGSTFATATNRGVTFEALETRSLTDANADTFFNPVTRRYELPVRVQALTAGTSGNIPPRTLTVIQGGAQEFDGVTNLVTFSGGTSAQSIRTAYERVQQKLVGLDAFSIGGLLSRVQNLDVDRIQAASLTYSSEYPSLFYRLPDKLALDVWTLNTPKDDLSTETFIATGGQTQFVLSARPVLYLSSVFVNGVPATASLTLDTSLAYGRSTRENSYVTLEVAASVGDVVDITYGYDTVLNTIQTEIDGYLSAETGSLFATDVLIRYVRDLNAACVVTGSALGTYDPTTIEQEAAVAVGTYLTNGLGDAPATGGVRSANELRDFIRSSVPGISKLNIPVFGRKSMGQIVETIDIPRNSRVSIASASDLVVKFT
jgi:hypothetical protein